jgi:ATP-dependent protease ClpP protease subunit
MLGRSLAFLGLVASLCLPAVIPAHAEAGFREYGSIAVAKSGDFALLVGAMTSRTAVDFMRASRENPGLVVLGLDSPGGDVHAGLLLAEQVRALGIGTMVTTDGTCASACAYVFMAGDRRIMNGRLGVHQFYGSETGQGDTQAVVSQIMESMNASGASPKVMEIMFRTKPDDMYFFSRQEVRAYGIESAGGSASPRQAAASEMASMIPRAANPVASDRIQASTAPVEPEAPKKTYTAFGGLDLYGGDLASIRVGSLAECTATCHEMDGCRAYTFNGDPKVRKGANCFLKGEGFTIDYNEVATSGYVGRPSIDTTSMDFRGIDPKVDVVKGIILMGNASDRPFLASGIGECRMACLGDDMCEAFSFETSSQTCQVFSEVTNESPLTGYVSGRRQHHRFVTADVVVQE